MWAVPNIMILDEIVEHKHEELATRKIAVPQADLQSQFRDCPPTRGFANALRKRSQGERREMRAADETPGRYAANPNVIAEIKGKSPSKGVICKDVDAIHVAHQYETGGAACISILTDSRFFGGAMERIQQVRKTVRLPLLQKDFIVDPYQLIEARCAGADCILLIIAALDRTILRDLYAEAKGIGLDVLVESHTQDELEFAIGHGFELIGINNRNLQTFDVSLETTVKLAALVPADRVLIGESGIFTKDDVDLLADAGVDGVLVGEALMSANNIEAKVREIAGR